MTADRIASSLVLLDQRLLAGLVCLILGLGLTVAVGFAGADTIHNAAHDTRHAIGFPCH